MMMMIIIRLYLPRREGGRRLISFEDAINIEERYINVYSTARARNVCRKLHGRGKMSNEIETPKEYKERMKRKRTEDWSEKQLHGQFKKETEDLSCVPWNWVRTGELKKEKKGLLLARKIGH